MSLQHPFRFALLLAMLVSGGMLALSSVGATGATKSAQSGESTPDAPRAVTTPCPGGSWQIIPSPNLGFNTRNELFDVAVASPNDAWAVGWVFGGQPAEFQGLILHWDGSQWMAAYSPVPEGATGVYLRGVEVIAPDDVWAVGAARFPNDQQRTLTIHWDGAQWSIVPSANYSPHTHHTLNGIVAASSTEIWAAGSSGNVITHDYALTYGWNGTQWSTGFVFEGDPYETNLRSLSVAAPDDVWAVGFSTYFPSEDLLIARWNGSQWIQVPGPDVGPFDNALYGVSAVGQGDAWAVGSQNIDPDEIRALTLRWSGSQWNVVPNAFTADPSNTWLRGVDATSPADVWAVGYRTEDDEPNMVQSLTMRWNGSEWSQVPSPNAGEYNYLNAVTVTGNESGPGADAWAVGSYSQQFGLQRTLVMRFDSPPCGNTTPTPTAIPTLTSIPTLTPPPPPTSTPVPPTCVAQWNYVPSPNVRSNDRLGPLVAIWANDVWVAGTSCSGQCYPLIEHWDGSAWSIVPGLETFSDMQLSGIAATSPNDLWAVGSRGAGGTVALHWNGAQWSVEYMPNVRADYATGMAALAPDDIWMVGSTCCGGGWRRTLIKHWDGNRWSIIPSPNPGPGQNELFDIAAIAPNDIWAVGTSGYLPLTLHWDGVTWNVVPAPTGAGGNTFLNGVAAVASNDVWAVGKSEPYTLIEHWDGNQWSVVNSPNPSENYNELNAVVALSSNDVWAVGDSVGPTLIAHWDGTSWSQVPSPSPYFQQWLYGVAAVSPTDIWAAGAYIRCTFCWDQTFIVHYSDPCATPEPTRTTTSTPTGTPPTATPTRTPTFTSTITPTPCGQQANYAVATASVTATIVPGTFDIGNHCHDCTTHITLPFPFQLYDRTFTEANVSSNGNMQFVSNSGDFYGICLPNQEVNYAILAYWDNLDTGTDNCPSCGIFTSVSGSAPNRIFNIEWRARSNFNGSVANFEARLYENSPEQRVDLIYAQATVQGDAAIGLQRDTGSRYAIYRCRVRSISPGTQVTFTVLPCSLPPTATATVTPTTLRTGTATTTTVPILTPTLTGTPTSTPTSCPIQFTDVPESHTFYAYIRCLACRGIVGGYSDGTFRPGEPVTRGQLSKIVSNSAGFIEPVSGQTFEDVPPDSPFFAFIERLASRRVVSGYECGGPGEPCLPPNNRPYFRPGNSVTRGQTAKIVAVAAGLPDPPAGSHTFQDVAPMHTFYRWVERMALDGVISGYACGGEGEPCIPPNDRPYFRPGNSVTRGQAAKITANTFFPGCAP